MKMGETIRQLRTAGIIGKNLIKTTNSRSLVRILLAEYNPFVFLGAIWLVGGSVAIQWQTTFSYFSYFMERFDQYVRNCGKNGQDIIWNVTAVTLKPRFLALMYSARLINKKVVGAKIEAKPQCKWKRTNRKKCLILSYFLVIVSCFNLH